MSDALVDRIDAYLGHPTTDPHGDPIPQADGTIAAAADRSLAECAPGERFRVARVIDQSPEFLALSVASGNRNRRPRFAGRQRAASGECRNNSAGRRKSHSHA